MSALRPYEWEKLGPILSPETIPGRIGNFSADAEPVMDNANESNTEDNWRLWFDQRENNTAKRTIGYVEGEIYAAASMRRVEAVLSEKILKPLPSGDTHTSLAVGNLPSGWNPHHPCHLKLLDGRHRLYFWTMHPGVIRYLCADSFDGGKTYNVIDPYRACFYHPHDRTVKGRSAPDGLTAIGENGSGMLEKESCAKPHEIVNDATSVYQLPDGSFEAYSAVTEQMPLGKSDPGYVAYDNAPGYRRFIRRFTSEDGLTWKNANTDLRPDGDDPADLQFYYLTVTHTKNGRVGMLGHYRCKDQTLDIEFCYSSDGISWKRPYRTTPWLPRGSNSEADCCIIMPGHHLVHHNNSWWLFYSGYNFLHNHSRSFGGPESSHLMAAKISGIPLP